MIYENEYQIGDQIKSTLNNRTGCIKCIIEKSSNDSTKYNYLVLSNENKYFIESEGFIKLIKKVSPEDDSNSSKKVREIAESCGYENDIKVGDVVKFHNHVLLGQYTVSSIIEMGYGEELYRYELIPIDYGNLSTTESCVCGSLLLEFQYHDNNWEKYITESVSNELPKWRGDLYNVYALCEDPDYPVSLGKYADDYKNDTLPPKCMLHISERHTIYGRINMVFTNTKNPRMERNKEIIMEKFNITSDRKLEVIIHRLKEKIILRNMNDVNLTTKELKNAASKRSEEYDPGFTDSELQIAYLVDKLDVEKDGIVDHYPIKLTNLQIMKAIQEAYKDAEKIGGKKIYIGKNSDKSDDEKLDAPYIGKQEYEGYSSVAGSIIRFVYNFDLNIIESAYPLRMNNNVKKRQN